jgi:hypothetical protein
MAERGYCRRQLLANAARGPTRRLLTLAGLTIFNRFDQWTKSS